ncbi:hypothetical protein [Streptomyces griseosporeus]|nr:hypothetical protein [Streptomyces griseosporeus]
MSLTFGRDALISSGKLGSAAVLRHPRLPENDPLVRRHVYGV